MPTSATSPMGPPDQHYTPDNPAKGGKTSGNIFISIFVICSDDNLQHQELDQGGRHGPVGDGGPGGVGDQPLLLTFLHVPIFRVTDSCLKMLQIIK